MLIEWHVTDVNSVIYLNLSSLKTPLKYHNPDWTQRNTCLSAHRGIPSAQLESILGCKIVEEALDRKMIFPEVLVDGHNDTVEKLNEKSVYHSMNIDIVKKECITHVMRNMMATFSTEYIDSLKEVTGKTLSEIESREIYNTSGDVGRIYHANLKKNSGNSTNAAKSKKDSESFWWRP